MTALRLAAWYWPHFEDASYYGYRMAVIVGPWLVMFGKAA